MRFDRLIVVAVVALAAVALLCSLTPNGAHARPPGAARVVGYFAEWTGAAVADIPARQLTHVNYAFAVVKDGQCAIDNPAVAIEKAYPAGDAATAAAAAPPADGDAGRFRGHFGQLRLLKQRHPHLKTLISIGGWGGSAEFSDVALDESSRKRFARSCADFASTYGFDGVDIDWEYPGGGGKEPGRGRPEDKHNFTLLLRDLRAQLDEQGARDAKQYLLTIAAPASRAKYQLLELDQIHPSLDWINVMTYDFAGGWSKLTGFNAPLYAPQAAGDAEHASADDTVRGYLAAGVPHDKIVLGVPFYGRAWGGVRNANDGLFQPHTAKPPTDAAAWENLARHYVDKKAKRFWHEQAKVPWLYDARSGLMVSYDDPQSMQHKGDYVRSHDLGGVMIWELSQDDDDASLLSALNAGLQGR